MSWLPIGFVDKLGVVSILVRDAWQTAFQSMTFHNYTGERIGSGRIWSRGEFSDCLKNVYLIFTCQPDWCIESMCATMCYIHFLKSHRSDNIRLMFTFSTEMQACWIFLPVLFLFICFASEGGRKCISVSEEILIEIVCQKPSVLPCESIFRCLFDMYLSSQYESIWIIKINNINWSQSIE